MKTCLKCMTTTRNDELKTCNICGGEEFRSGRPKNGYKMDPTEDSSVENKNTDTNDKTEIVNKEEHERITEKHNKVSEQTKYNYDYSIAESNDEVTLGKWIVTFIIMAIPLVNIIYAIITILQKNKSRTYINYMKAALIMSIIAIVVSVALGSVISAFIANLMYSLY